MAGKQKSGYLPERSVARRRIEALNHFFHAVSKRLPN
jgi:hypothetical protein